MTHFLMILRTLHCTDYVNHLSYFRTNFLHERTYIYVQEGLKSDDDFFRIENWKDKQNMASINLMMFNS